MQRHTHLTEKMDHPDATRADLEISLRFIRRVNRFLGGTGAVMAHVRRFSRAWNPAGPITIADIATGSADIPAAILAWSRRAGFDVRVTAVDLHPTTLSIAREWTANTPQLSFVRADALRLPLADASVDYATCSMFLHHLEEPAALAVVREMLRVSRRGIIVNDLLRSRWAYAGVWLMTIGAADIDQWDARVSVKKAWTRREVAAWPAALGAPWLRYHPHLFARFTLAGEKP